MEPIDKQQCQAEKPNGATFMSIGGVPKMIRCTNKPTVIATETQSGSDGIKGAMSLCDDCLKVASEQLPVGFFDIVPISNISVTVHQFKNAGACFLWKRENAKHLLGQRHFTCSEIVYQGYADDCYEKYLKNIVFKGNDNYLLILKQ